MRSVFRPNAVKNVKRPVVMFALAAALGAAAMPARADFIPIIGAAPTLTDSSSFSNTDWQAQIHSYAFVGPFDLPDALGLPDPGVGQTLFVYVIRMNDDPMDRPDSVIEFDVGNPYARNIPEVGFTTDIVPNDGLGDEYTGARQDPSTVQNSIVTQSVSYFYNKTARLDPGSPQGEYSVLYILADAVPGFVQATVTGGPATFDEHLILGPVPEPGTVALLSLGLAFFARRRVAGK